MKVTLGEEALAQIAALPRAVKPRIWAVADRLEQWPKVSGVKWLTGDWKS